MSALVLLLVGVIVLGGLVGAYAWLAPRRPEPARRPAGRGDALDEPPAWDDEAANEFGALSESARCDLVFAVAMLDDARSQSLLEHALADPSEVVALAAARGLRSLGQDEALLAYAQAHPGVRAQRLLATLALME
ncbi:MAG: hypothetical protein ACYDHD_05375 [Vulcanimicrobiaceae bacterium]